MQGPTFTSTPSSPLIIEEGLGVTLEWMYNLTGNQLFAIQLSTQIDGETKFPIQKFLGSPTPSTFGDYTGRITASVNDTFTSISLIPVKRTDSNTYTFALQTGGGPIQEQVKLIVHCK